MRKLIVFEHLDNGTTLEAEIEVIEEDGHWKASITKLEGEGERVQAPKFYGSTPDQAERQLIKVFEKEYDLISQKEVSR